MEDQASERQGMTGPVHGRNYSRALLLGKTLSRAPSATGTSSPAGANRIAASSFAGGVSCDPPTQAAPKERGPRVATNTSQPQNRARNDRGSAGWEFPLDNMQIRSTHAADLDPNERGAGFDDRDRQVRPFQRMALDRTRPTNDHGLHPASFCRRPIHWPYLTRRPILFKGYRRMEFPGNVPGHPPRR